MASSGMLRRVALTRTCIAEEIIASIIRVTNISSQLASVASYTYVPSSPILFTLMMEALISSETLVLTRATRRNILEEAILQNRNLVSNVTERFGHEYYRTWT
jgi:hypothetical protein